MRSEEAEAVADALGGVAYHSASRGFHVLIDRPDGSVVEISAEAIALYRTNEDPNPEIRIRLKVPAIDENGGHHAKG